MQYWRLMEVSPNSCVLHGERNECHVLWLHGCVFHGMYNNISKTLRFASVQSCGRDNDLWGMVMSFALLWRWLESCFWKCFFASVPLCFVFRGLFVLCEIPGTHNIFGSFSVSWFESKITCFRLHRSVTRILCKWMLRFASWTGLHLKGCPGCIMCCGFKHECRSYITFCIP